MKKIILAFSIVCMVATVACNKDKSDSTQSTLKATKTADIKMGEPVLFTMTNSPAGAEATWAVTPNDNVTISNSENAASILFGKKGTYNVTATTGTLQQRTMVTIDSTVYDTSRTGHTPPTDTLKSLIGDEILLTPSVSGLKDSSILVLSAITTKKYNCLNNFLVSNLSNSAGNYTITYPGVNIPGTCAGGRKKATAMTFIYPVSAGVHSFSVVVNGTTYKGSFTKTGGTYTFTWPYTTGVKLAPLVVK